MADPSPPPAVEPARHRTNRAISSRQIAPRNARALNPQMPCTIHRWSAWARPAGGFSSRPPARPSALFVLRPANRLSKVQFPALQTRPNPARAMDCRPPVALIWIRFAICAASKSTSQTQPVTQPSLLPVTWPTDHCPGGTFTRKVNAPFGAHLLGRTLSAEAAGKQRRRPVEVAPHVLMMPAANPTSAPDEAATAEPVAERSTCPLRHVTARAGSPGGQYFRR